jgi:phage shock protein PspC (stress-responsive transcriptional regulator)
MIAGVCGGLGKYFSVDPTIVRLVFLLLLILGGSGFLLYIVLWIVVPDEQQLGASPQDVVQANTQELAQSARDFGQSVGQAVGSSSGDVAQSAARNGPLIFAVILIFLGIWFLLQNLLHIDLGQLWPVILIIIGLALLIPALRKPQA